MFTLKCSSCDFIHEVATENEAEAAAFKHCRAHPEHRITCTRPAQLEPGRIPVIVFSTEVR